VRLVAAQPADGARAAGAGRQRHHECEYGAGSFRYPGRLQGRGFGHNALVVATAFTLGPTIASGILAIGPWSWLFAINIPFGLVAILIGPEDIATHPASDACLRFSRRAVGSGMSWPSHSRDRKCGSSRAAWTGVDRTCLRRAAWLGSDPQTGGSSGARAADRLFSPAAFALSTATAICSFAVQGLAFVSLPFYFEDILGRSQVETGFFMTPWPLVVAMMAPIAGRLSNRYPAGILGGLGLALLGVGMALLAMLPASPHVADIVWRMAICGCGFGFFKFRT